MSTAEWVDYGQAMFRFIAKVGFGVLGLWGGYKIACLLGLR